MDYDVLLKKRHPKTPEKDATPKPTPASTPARAPAPSPAPAPASARAATVHDVYIPPPINDVIPIIRPVPMCPHGLVPTRGMMMPPEPIHSRPYGPNLQYDPYYDYNYYGGGQPHRHISRFAPLQAPPRSSYGYMPPPPPYYDRQPPPPPPYYNRRPPPITYYNSQPQPSRSALQYDRRGYGYDLYDGYDSDEEYIGCKIM